MFDIPGIPVITLTDNVRVAKDAMQAPGLRESRYSGPDAMPDIRIIDHSGENMAIGRHIGPGTHQAHRSQQYVKKLRQLVQVRPPEPSAQSCDTPIVRRHPPVVSIVVDDHAPKFVAIE
jgi:hypothetical protein